MKSCTYCGRQHEDTVAICQGCGTPLAGESGGPTAGQAQAKVVCPSCGLADNFKPAVALRGSFSLVFFLLGGIWAVILRNASRERRVQCNGCGGVFGIRTPAANLSGFLLGLLIGLPFLVLLLFLVRFLFSK